LGSWASFARGTREANSTAAALVSPPPRAASISSCKRLCRGLREIAPPAEVSVSWPATRTVLRSRP
jgi:hypothetical protein